MTKISQYANTLASISSTDLMDVSKDIGGGSFQTNKMTFAVLLSGIRTTTDTILGGQALSALAQAPTVTEDGFVITWNNGAGEYQLLAGGGGGGGNTIYTADDSLTSDRIITNAGFDLTFSGLGNLGIGDSPGSSTKLRVKADVGSTLIAHFLDNLNADVGRIFDNGNVMWNGTMTINDSLAGSASLTVKGVGSEDIMLGLLAGGSPMYKIDALGNVAIGHASPTVPLHVVGSTLLDGTFTVKNSTTFTINSAGNLCQLGGSDLHFGIGTSPSSNYRLRIGGGPNSGMNFMFRISDTIGVVLQSVGTTGATIISSNSASSFGFGTLYDGNVLVKIGGSSTGGQNKTFEMSSIGNALRMDMDINGKFNLTPRSDITNGFSIDATLFVSDSQNSRIGIGNAAPTEKLDVTGNIKISGVYNVGANVGVTEVLNFNGVASGEVLTQTVTGGIVTARTLVP